jgi:hypothetical protein
MNTGRSEITESDLPGGVVIAVRPPPGILVGQVASTCVPYGAVTLEPLGPASVSVLAEGLQPGDWMDVDLLTDRRVSIDSVRGQFVPPERQRVPRRRRLRPYDGTQLAVDLIGFPFAVTAAVLVARALPHTSETALDDAARYGWFLLAVWALMSLWGLMDQSLRYIGRSEWPGHPRVSLRWVDPDVQRP